MYAKELVQAVSNWQRGGSPTQKEKRGLAVLKLAARLPDKFRKVDFVCFRQISLDEKNLRALFQRSNLPETISAWTLSSDVAKRFKRGVPPKGQGFTGAIFEHKPNSSEVVLNLHALFSDPVYIEACKKYAPELSGFVDGTRKYWDDQLEVILKIDKIGLDDIHALGGHSSEEHQFASYFFGPNPSAVDLASFQLRLKKIGRELGPEWITGEGKERSINRIRKMAVFFPPGHHE